MTLRFLSICSGIEAASVAWEPLGWRALAFSEIEPFPRAVLRHRFPGVPLHGDFTVLRDQPWIVDADVLVGGTPCQAFSVAGLRRSLSDDRGNLSLEYIRLADAVDDLRRAAGRAPAWIVWENVPGVLSTPDNAFGAFLGGLVGSDAALVPNGRWTDAGVVAGPRRVAAWRTLDAQYFGLAQRRRRVFVLAREHPGGWACADALLPITDSLQGHPAPRREAGEGVARPLASCPSGGSGYRNDADTADNLIGFSAKSSTVNPGSVAPTLDVSAGRGRGASLAVACLNGHGEYGASLPTLRAKGGDAADGSEALLAGTVSSKWAKGTGGPSGDECQNPIVHTLRGEDFDAGEGGTGRGTPLVPVAFDTTQITSAANRSQPQAGGPCHPLAAGAHPPAIAFSCKDHGADAAKLAPTLPAMGFDRSHANAGGQLAVAFDWYASSAQSLPVSPECPPLKATMQPAVAVSLRDREGGGMAELSGEMATALRASQGGGDKPHVLTSAVRRLTPRECERLQGFPDDWTLIPWRKGLAPDGPRYRALGNSMAVPCMAWIGQRIALADGLVSYKLEAAE